MRWSWATPRVWRGALLGALCALFLQTVSGLGWLDKSNRSTLGWMFRVRGPRFPDPNIVIIVADDATVTRAKSWPLPRSLHARVLQRLVEQGAKTVAFDILFSEPSPSLADDELLAKLSRRANNVVQAAAFIVPSISAAQVPASTRANVFTLPNRFAVSSHNVRAQSAVWVSSSWSALSQSAASIGHLNIFPESDGSLLRIPHLIRYRDRVFPSLALAASAHWLGIAPQEISAHDQFIDIGVRRVPIDNEGESWINWSGSYRTFPTFTYQDVLDGRVGRAQLKNRMVFVGIVAAGAYEFRSTPFSSAQPAIELQANAANDILQNRPLHIAPDWSAPALLVLVCLATGALVAPRQARSGTLWALALAASWMLTAVLLLTFIDTYLPLMEPLAGVILTYAVVMSYNYRRSWEASWRADSAMTTLAGGALIAAGYDRQRLRQVALQTAREVLDAQYVWIVTASTCTPPVSDKLATDETLRAELANAVMREQRAILWPAAIVESDERPSEMWQRVRQIQPQRTHLNKHERSSERHGFQVISEHADLHEICAHLFQQMRSSRGSLPLSRTLVAAPLMQADEGENQNVASGEVFVALGQRNGRIFGPREAILLENLAAQTALALENVAFHEQLQGRIEAADRELALAYSVMSEQNIKMLASIENIEDVIIITDENACAVYVNGAAWRILRGATPPIGTNVPLFLNSHGWPELATLFDSLIPSPSARVDKADSPQKIQREFVRHVVLENAKDRSKSDNTDLKPLVLSSHLVPLLGENKCPLGAMLVVADVTLQRELDRMKTEFISYVAHELRTPLTTILGYASLLQGAGENMDSAQRGEMSSVIVEHCKRLNGMISELLDVSRLDAGHTLSFRPQYADLVALGERMLNEHRRALGNREEYQMAFEAPIRPIMADFDPDRIEQVLNNLLSNAFKYSPEGGLITLQVLAEGDEVVLHVRDQGMGMSAEQVTNLFQKYYRTPDAQQRGIKGTGLGLYLVKQLVEAHGGRIEVQSQIGQGTTFSVYLPKKWRHENA